MSRRHIAVLHVLKFFRPRFTGHGVFLERITPVFETLDRTIEHDLLVTETPEPKLAVPVSSSLRRIFYLGPRQASDFVFELKLAVWMLRHGWQYRVVHLHTHVDRYFLSYLLLKLFGKKLILSATLDDSVPSLIATYRPSLRPLIRQLFSVFDAFIAISPKLQAETVSIDGPEKARMIPIGVVVPAETGTGRAQTRAQLGLSENDLVLIFVGGICDRKDPLFLVEQMPEILTFCRMAKLVIVGPVLEEDHYKRMLEAVRIHKLADRVLFLGEAKDPYPYFAMADIMVFASHLEGFGAVVTEGMAHALPPVVRHLPGINDLFIRHEETGFLFTDARGYVLSIRKLSDSPPARRAIGDAARKTVLAEFDNVLNAQRLLDVYGNTKSAVGSTRSDWLLPIVGDRAAINLPANACVLDPRFHTPAKFHNDRPTLITSIDAEETFDWSQPLSRREANLSSMSRQVQAHAIFDRYGVIPIYLVTYPVATNEDGYRPLRELLSNDKCEVGAQLHTWMTPPYDEAVTEENSFGTNLGVRLEFEKLRRLTLAIENTFEMKPLMFRAGRYGVGRRTGDMLKTLGYQIDSSVVPYFDFSGNFGTNFDCFNSMPYWIDVDKKLLEVPLTTALVGHMADAFPAISRAVFARVKKPAIFRAALARSRMVERIKLSPEGTTISEAKRLTRSLLSRGQRVFMLSYHSPSLVPGSTPYVRSQADLDGFLRWLDEFYEFFLGEIGGAASTPRAFYSSCVVGRRETCEDTPHFLHKQSHLLFP